MTGDNLIQTYGVTTSRLFYSFNGGSTWTPFVYGAQTSIPTGRDLRIKLDLNASDAQVLAAGFAYKF